MKTDDLVELLARGAGPAPQAAAARRLAPAAAAGALASALGALLVMGPIPAAMLATPAPWIKLAYAGALALAAGWWVARLARPAAPAAAPRRALLVVLAAMALLGAGAWFAAPAGERLPALLGVSWQVCPLNVLLLSLPALAAGLWALRGLAPVRPRTAGFAAGLFAGALGALGYSLACPELAASFVAVWYTLGIGLAALAGAALAPFVLRW